MSSTTREYLECLVPLRGDAILVTTMTAAKIWPQIADGVLDFNYLPSAMSHAADIALGLTLAAPRRKVICVNGDGSLVMNLGGLITAADTAATNLLMLVMDNGVYEVVGGGRIPGAGRTDYAALAAWFSLLPVANDAPTLPLPLQSAWAGTAATSRAAAAARLVCSFMRASP